MKLNGFSSDFLFFWFLTAILSYCSQLILMYRFSSFACQNEGGKNLGFLEAIRCEFRISTKS